MKYRIDRAVIEGDTSEALMEQIRKGWMWNPSFQEMFRFASLLTKQPIKNADDYISAMLSTGALKPTNK